VAEAWKMAGRFIVYACVLLILLAHFSVSVKIDRLTMGASPYGSNAPKPYRWAICAPYSYISSGEPCPFTKVPVAVKENKLIT
jgi:hypothetical protein